MSLWLMYYVVFADDRGVPWLHSVDQSFEDCKALINSALPDEPYFSPDGHNLTTTLLGSKVANLPFHGAHS